MTRSDEDPEGDGDDEQETETEAESVTGTETDSTESTDGTVPLSDLKEEVVPDTDEPSDGEQVATEDDPAEADQEQERSQGIPLSELRDDVVEGADAPETVGELFHEERVEEVEAEAVWADLLMGSGDTEAIFDPTAVEAELGREYQIVPKTLCHRCEYFGDPPTLHCTHEGTTIHETVDMDHYRVSECPMIRTDRDPREE